MTGLSIHQKCALLHLSQYPHEWRQDTPAVPRTLTSLKKRGLVEFAFDDSGYWEKITDEGISELFRKDLINIDELSAILEKSEKSKPNTTTAGGK